MAGKVSSAEVQTFLKNIDYPVNKEQLMDHAKKQGATEDVMSLLKKMRKDKYTSPVDVNKAISEAKGS